MGVREAAIRAFDRRIAAPRELRDRLAGLTRPPAVERTQFVGPDPLRILVFGAGLFAGYGVTTWRDSLGGRIAQRLADQSGRGIVLERRIVPNVSMPNLAELLGSVGAHTFDLVLWSPTFDETAQIWKHPRWGTALQGLIRHLHETGDGRAVVAILEVPTLTGGTPVERAGNISVASVNRRIAAATRRMPQTVRLTPPALGPLYDTVRPHPLNAEYYQATCDAVAPRLSAALAAARGALTAERGDWS